MRPTSTDTQLFESYFTHVADAIFVMELNGRVRDANPAVCQLLGYSKAQLLEMHAWELIPQRSHTEIWSMIENLQSGLSEAVQLAHNRSDGQVLMLDLRLTRFSSGEHDLVIVSCRDITERKALEAQLHEREQTLAEGQRLTQTGTWVLNPWTGHNVWSVELCRIFGFPDSPPSPTYQDFRARVHSQYREAVDEMLRQSLESGEPRLLQYLYVLPDGTRKRIETVSQPVRDESGRVVRLMGTAMDVTRRYESEQALQASEKLARGQMQALTRTLDAMSKESAPDRFLEHVLLTVVQQLDGRSLGLWQRVDGDCLEGFEYSIGQMPDITHFPLFSLRPMDSPHWQEICRTGKCAVCEDVAQVLALPHREQLMAQGVVTVLLIPLLIAGEVSGLLSVRFDHHRTFREEELELAQALAHQATLALQLTRLSQQSRLSAVIAERNRLARALHDTLAQGFTGVIVQLEAAKDASLQGLTGEADDHIQRASETARYGLNEARRSVMALRPQTLEEKDLCAALRHLLEWATLGTHLRAHFTVQGVTQQLPPSWDEHLLRIGQEALTNTLRHSRAHEFSAQLHFEATKVSFHLSDDGCGFDVGEKSGGFGLRGIKERVAEMRGHIITDSTLGRGTSIRISLPLGNELETAYE